MEKSQKGCRVQIHLNGRVSEALSTGQETVLDVALRLGIDPPYSCMTGSCSTCLAKILRGTVIGENPSDRLILTCQSGIDLQCEVLEVSYDQAD